MNALDVPHGDAQRIIQTAQALRTEYVSWRFEHRKGFGAKQIQIAELERQTRAFREFRIEAVPGLLQTHEYARSAMSLANFTRQTDLDFAIRLRMQRQEILYDPSRQFDFLIAEMGILSRFCEPNIVIRQLDRLKVLSGLPNVNIGLIPNRIPLPRAPINSFIVFDSSTATLESITGEISTSDEQDIETYHTIYKDFAAAAIYGADAGVFLDECMQYLLGAEQSLQALSNFSGDQVSSLLSSGEH